MNGWCVRKYALKVRRPGRIAAGDRRLYSVWWRV